MRKLLIFLTVTSLIIGAAVAVPMFGPAQGFRNPGAVELGSLTIDGVDINGGAISYDSLRAEMVVNETAINSSIDALTLAAYTNETAINTSIDNLVVPLATFAYDANSVDQGVFTASGAWTLTAVKMTPRVVGSSGSAVTVMVKICDSGEAPASGDNMLSSTLDLKGTADTPQSGTVSAGSIANGKIVALDFTGDLTAAVGVITLYGTRA